MKLRKELGSDSDEALRLLRSIKEEAGIAAPTKCPHCGESIE